MRLGQLELNRKIISWAFYDWANSAFATTVLTFFFPIFFNKFYAQGVDPQVASLQLGFANSLAGGVLAAMSPFLGAVADQGRGKKKLLGLFAGVGIVLTGALTFIGRGEWEIAIACFVCASVGFAGANSFYDSLLSSVTDKAHYGLVSSLGFSIGYLGGGILFAINVLMTLKPSFFGLSDSAEAVRYSFMTVALWWVFFAIPLFLWVPEPPGRSGRGWRDYFRLGFCEVLATAKHIRELKMTLLFLVAYFFYIDGVNTVIKMAADFAMKLGFDTNTLIKAGLLAQFVAFPAALAFGAMAHRIGAKKAIMIGIVVYLFVTVYAVQISETWEFYFMAVVIGLVQGGVQSLSRSLFAHLSPPEKSGEFFGFYNMLGKFSTMLGPVLMGAVGVITGSTRMSMLAVILLFVIGFVLLWFVKVPHEKNQVTP